MKHFRTLLVCLFVLFNGAALVAQSIHWAPVGHSYYTSEETGIVECALPDPLLDKNVLVPAAMLIPPGASKPLKVRNFEVSTDARFVLIYTNSQRVWRYDTRGDYWLLDRKSGALTQLGKGRPAASLMFAKLSPDGKKVAYVSEHNLYVEYIETGKIDQLSTTNGTSKLINGTFDWVYEEEFDCRDGFRWSPDSRHIAYWQIDANQIRDFFMIDNTDSIYPYTIPVEYPKVGESPSPYKIGVVDIDGVQTQWMNIPGDPRQTYLPRMEWTPDGAAIFVQQLNRKQNESLIMQCDPVTGVCTALSKETDAAWVDLQDGSMTDYFKWLEGGKSYLWSSEKDGWRHYYRVGSDGKSETLLTKGDYDVISMVRADEAGGYLYFMASPDNATQSYLYRVKLDGSSRKAERLSPGKQSGTFSYNISPDAQYAQCSFSNYYTPRERDWVSLPKHQAAFDGPVEDKGSTKRSKDNQVEFFQVTTEEGITMDGWLVKPNDFDPSKKYPIVFYVYTEPAAATVRDVYGVGNNHLYNGDMAADGYIYASLDGRGTPAPKGRAWRKAIYRNIGQVNIRDQAQGAQAMFKRWHWIDTSRVAVWGWSGGGSTTLNCLFQYPDVYQTGIAVAAVANQLTYDNIYQERYMGLPQENKEDFVKGSPITYAKNLRGNLLYIHGTGDDNVHYQNAEMLVNALIKYNKYFQFMPYPNRSHGIFEGEGTSKHLSTMYTEFLRRNCPPGGR